MKKGLFVGMTFWLLAGSAAIFGTFFMMIPLLPLMYISAKLFRRLIDHMIGFYIVYVVVSGSLDHQ